MDANYNTLLGVRIDPVTMGEVILWIRSCIQNRSYGNYINVLNVAKLVKAKENHDLFNTIWNANIVGADGVPLIWLSNFIGKKLPERINGTDLMMQIFKHAHQEHWSIYFLGSDGDNLEKVIKLFKQEFSNAKIAGYRNGYFLPSEEQSLIGEINDSDANILLLGFSTPKKEWFVNQWKNTLKVNVIHGVGGSFDVYAGKVKRAPIFMQRYGLEWFYRLLQEPQRMFGRYFVTNIKIIYYCLRYIITKK